MLEVNLSADELVTSLLALSQHEPVCLLDSCGVGHLDSHLLIAGLDPVETFELLNDDPAETLSLLDKKLEDETAAIFTLSYEFGNKILGLVPRHRTIEPDVFLARFDALVIHDYRSGTTTITGTPGKAVKIGRKLTSATLNFKFDISNEQSYGSSNFTRSEYLDRIELVKEHIRRGDTYQTNLTQQLTVDLPGDLTPQSIFYSLRRDHPAAFAAFIKRHNSTVVSASPERFFKVSEGGNPTGSGDVQRRITTSPIKGTRPRGNNAAEDDLLRSDLLTSAKDAAENTMIVDLLRNDLGRICEYGSVRVDSFCDIEEHPTFFHLVSTVHGDLRAATRFSEILTALFPCGSITGAPKISTMRIIDEIETQPRGLSMGAIGYRLPGTRFGVPETTDLSVAIRTMVIRDRVAAFNVGGGIVIDSDPGSEYEESFIKAKALLSALGANMEHFR